MRTLRVTTAYDGGAYAGWQRQPGAPTIQAALEQALGEVEGKPVTVHGAGRTDAGVHALGQVASTRITHTIPAAALVRALNAKLPGDIRVLRVEDVGDEFHARFAARSKTYRYVLDTGSVPNPLIRRYAWHQPHPLDFHTMGVAGDALCGEHDFAAYQTAQGDDGPASTVRTVEAMCIDTHGAPPWLTPSNPGPIVTIEVTADGFLRHMVRAMVGTLVEVALGRRSVDSVTASLVSGRRQDAGPTAPAQGLFLVRVRYDPPFSAPGS